MEDSILVSIKQMLGIYDEDTAFDGELILHINGALADLTHVGVGPKEGFTILDKSTRWDEFSDNQTINAQAKIYVFCKVRLIFDPPSNSFVVDSITKTKDEAQWRLYMIADEENLT